MKSKDLNECINLTISFQSEVNSKYRRGIFTKGDDV